MLIDEDDDYVYVSWWLVIPVVALIAGVLMMAIISGSKNRNNTGSDFTELRQSLDTLKEYVAIQGEIEEMLQEAKASQTSKETPKNIQEFLMEHPDEASSVLKTIAIVIGLVVAVSRIKRRSDKNEKNTGNLPSVYYR